jgi:zeta-carotene desaturase
VSRRIAIIGGGLAGIAAAVRLAEAGDRPIVVETRKRLGGRATSLVDPRSGATIDNCQHVLLGCCTNLIDLYQRLDMIDAIDWHDELHWAAGGVEGAVDTLRRDWLPAPLHLARSMRGMRLLSRDSKRAIARAILRMIRLGPGGRMKWEPRTFNDFLNDCDQPLEAVRRFWEPIVVSACNLALDRVSAAYAIQVFQDGFLANRRGYLMGVPKVPLGRLYDPVATIIDQAGGEVRLGCSVRALAFDGRRITGVVTDDDMIEASAFVAAVPPDRLNRLCSESLKRADRRLQRLDEFRFSPIVGVHAWFDREIMRLPHLVLIERGVQWLFNKGVAREDDDVVQHLHAVISAADQWLDLDEAVIVQQVVQDIHHALPQSVGLQPMEARAIKEKRATIALTPGIDDLRPSAGPAFRGGVENLLLAGDWCDTGWPATMESAVRSGYAAAAALTDGACLVADLPAGPLARLAGLRSV